MTALSSICRLDTAVGKSPGLFALRVLSMVVLKLAITQFQQMLDMLDAACIYRETLASSGFNMSCLYKHACLIQAVSKSQQQLESRQQQLGVTLCSFASASYLWRQTPYHQ